jgi:DNA-3-methyladenine glycosylase
LSVLAPEFFAGDVMAVAPALLGKVLVRDDGRRARLVEVEAYAGAQDPGSHAYRGPTPRTAVMFGPPGHLYVYFSYGMHWCANVVCGPPGQASAVLLRAAQPLAGLEAMRQARSVRLAPGARPIPDRDLCRGPGRLCQAFGLHRDHNGLLLAPGAGPLWLADDGAGPGGPVAVTTRVGLAIDRGAHLPYRFLVTGNRWVSPNPRP